MNRATSVLVNLATTGPTALPARAGICRCRTRTTVENQAMTGKRVAGKRNEQHPFEAELRATLLLKCLIRNRLNDVRTLFDRVPKRAGLHCWCFSTAPVPDILSVSGITSNIV